MKNEKKKICILFVLWLQMANKLIETIYPFTLDNSQTESFKAKIVFQKNSKCIENK